MHLFRGGSCAPNRQIMSCWHFHRIESRLRKKRCLTFIEPPSRGTCKLRLGDILKTIFHTDILSSAKLITLQRTVFTACFCCSVRQAVALKMWFLFPNSCVCRLTHWMLAAGITCHLICLIVCPFCINPACTIFQSPSGNKDAVWASSFDGDEDCDCSSLGISHFDGSDRLPTFRMLSQNNTILYKGTVAAF